MLHFIILVMLCMPVPVVERSRAWVCDRSLAGILGSKPARGRTFVCCECRMLPGRGFCDEMTTRAEEFNRLRRVDVCVCDLKTLNMWRPWPEVGRCATEKIMLFCSIVFDLSLILCKNLRLPGCYTDSTRMY